MQHCIILGCCVALEYCAVLCSARLTTPEAGNLEIMLLQKTTMVVIIMSVAMSNRVTDASINGSYSDSQGPARADS